MRITKNQNGSIDALLAPLIIASLLVLLLGGFGGWAYLQYQHQKNDTDAIVSAAVEEAKGQQEAELRAQFAEDEKKPNKTYTSPSSTGSVKIVYPKTWSAYVDEQEAGGTPLSGAFHPNFVPADSATPYALMVEVVDTAYSDEIDDYSRDIEAGEVQASAIEKANTVGMRLDGKIEPDYTGVMVLFPIRDKTLKIWTRSDTYKNDFVNTVLANLSFSP